MYDGEKFSWGEIDLATRSLEDTTPIFQSLYDRGHYRMRPDDVVRLKKYLKRISASTAKMRSTLKMFENLIK